MIGVEMKTISKLLILPLGGGLLLTACATSTTPRTHADACADTMANEGEPLVLEEGEFVVVHNDQSKSIDGVAAAGVSGSDTVRTFVAGTGVIATERGGAAVIDVDRPDVSAEKC